VRITKVVVFPTTNPTKLVLHFYEFSTILYGFYKFLQKVNTVPEHLFTQAPRSLRCLQRYPRFAIWSSERVVASQWGSRAPAGGGPAKFQRTAGRDRPGTGGDQPSGFWGSILGLGWAGGGPAWWGRRRPAAVAAAAAVPARWRFSGGNGHAGELGEVQGKVGEGLLWCAADRAWSSLRLPAMAPVAARPRHGRDEKGGDLFIGDKCACQRPKRPTETSRSKRRPRQECTAGETLDRPAVRPVPARPRGVRRGRTSRWPRDVRGFGE
jgi:hypothetical protein